MALPSYFYNIEHPVRWVDKFSHPDGDDKLILSPMQWREKDSRDRDYARWIGKPRKVGGQDFRMSPKMMKWQVVQILRGGTRKDWWTEYKDALFRVFVNPHHVYSGEGWKAWYILCPEDGFLTLSFESRQKGFQPPARRSFKWLPKEERFRRMRLVPVDCCRHWRHEKTAGIDPGGL